MNIVLDTICVRVTTKCNMKCRHCWAPFSDKVTDIDLIELINFISLLKSTVGLKHVSLSGGEPTLYPHIRILLEKLFELNLYVSITTNGTSSTILAEIVKHSKFINTSKLNIRLSIDGWKTFHDSIRGNGSYDTTIQEARHLSGMIGRVSFNTVVMDKPNFSERIFSDLSFVRIADWALITPISRGRLKSNQSNKKEIFTNIDLWKKSIKGIKPSLDLFVWDYLSHPNGGILIEVDGEIKMPGILEKDDIVIGRIQSIKITSLRQQIEKRLKKDPVAYFYAQNNRLNLAQH